MKLITIGEKNLIHVDDADIGEGIIGKNNNGKIIGFVVKHSDSYDFISFNAQSFLDNRREPSLNALMGRLNNVKFYQL